MRHSSLMHHPQISKLRRASRTPSSRNFRRLRTMTKNASHTIGIILYGRNWHRNAWDAEHAHSSVQHAIVLISRSVQRAKKEAVSDAGIHVSLRSSPLWGTVTIPAPPGKNERGRECSTNTITRRKDTVCWVVSAADDVYLSARSTSIYIG